MQAAGTAKTPTGTRLLALPAESSNGDLHTSLTELARGELVFQRVGSVFTGETEYIFKHSLLRDVAYERLPHKHRKVYHLAVARWLEAHAGLHSGLRNSRSRSASYGMMPVNTSATTT